MNDPSKGYLKIESESCFFPKKAVIILAMTVFPKRLGRVMHIWVLPESKNGIILIAFVIYLQSMAVLFVLCIRHMKLNCLDICP
mgnify:CR=1 FL=1